MQGEEGYEEIKENNSIFYNCHVLDAGSEWKGVGIFGS